MDPYLIKGGHNIYGHRIGILMIEGTFPRPPGAIGNASTFPFPVLHHVVKGFSGTRTVRDLGALDPDQREFHEAIQPWIDGAKYLQGQGCRGITTSCGFAILFQRHMLEAVSIPVFSSSLMLLPFIASIVGKAKRVGVITAEASSLTERHLRAAGVDPNTVCVTGMDGCPEFAATAWHDRQTLNVISAQREAVEVAKKLLLTNSSVGAILLECSLLPPYAGQIQAETGLPVFDFTHLVSLVHSALARTSFTGLV